MLRRTLLKTPLLAAAAGVTPRIAWGQAPAATQQTIENFFRFPQFSRLKLSPNGQFLAAIAPVKGRGNLAVIDLTARKSMAITSMTDKDVRDFWWVNDERLAFNLIDLRRALGEQLGAGLYAVDRDGGNGRELSTTSPISATGAAYTFRYSEFLSTITHEDKPTDDILVLANDRNNRFPDVYRMDTRSGRKALLTFDSPGEVTSWIVDQAAVPRAAVVDERSGNLSVHHRADGNSPWRKLGTFNSFKNEPEAFIPVAFDYDGSMIVAARAGGDKLALYRYDVAAGKLGQSIAAHKDYDIQSGLLFDRRKKALVGVTFEAEKREFTWFDQEWATWQKMIDQTLPGHVNVLARAQNAPIVLVASYSDKDPTSYYLFDPDKKQLERGVSARPWIEPAKMAPQRFLRYTARDGLGVPAYLTLPPGKEAKNLPLVVLVHGGPWVRGETWAWHDQAQFLASRGYAVLQPDFRGSLGYGWKHFTAGWKQWGLTMQDDLNDGVEHLVKEGIVDRSRTCIAGASYGGYAVMMGLARDPDFWKCGINFVGVTDLDLQQSATWSDTARLMRDMDLFLETLIGSRTADRAQFDKTSPVRLADRIKRPVLMAYGGLDQRVPIEHGEGMRTALAKTKVPVEYVVYEKEGHGFLLEENRFDFWRRVEKFLAEHLK